jgi:hypothetical protein
MATTTDLLKIGHITVRSAMDNKEYYFSFPGFYGSTSFKLANLSTFKTSNETNFFSSDVNNAQLKSRVYNDLRIEAKKFAWYFSSNSFLIDWIKSFSLYSTSYSGLAALRDAAYSNKIAIARKTEPFKFSSKSVNVYLYLPVQYDTVTKRAYFQYRGNDAKREIIGRFT